ncbi:hypothetical protein F0223_25535 [Vibrio coralliilyticus]|nr:hypothetical protein [Vibrio coralliilyticus]
MKYYLYHNNTSWLATINQLNSDVLKRHILPRSNTHCLNLNFSFCESENTGEIRDSLDRVLGHFYIWQDEEISL